MASLWDRFTDLDNLQQAWKKVASNRGCAGVDGETISHFAQKADLYLRDLRAAVCEHRYQPLPLRQIKIPKQNGGQRILRVPTVRDRILQQAMLNILHPVLEPHFESNSFAYRPGRSHQMAVRKVGYWHRRGYEWILDADIVRFFDNVSHARLLTELRERCDHPQFLELVEDWISVGSLTQQGLVFPQRGIPQGAVVSPILANVYLDDFDENCLQKNLKLVRYADDFVILGQSQEQILDIRSQVTDWLGEMQLLLHPDKTQITSFQKGFKFLGHIFVRDTIIPVKKRQQDQRERTPESPYRIVHSDAHIPPTAMQQALLDALLTSHQPVPPPLFVVLVHDGPNRSTMGE